MTATTLTLANGRRLAGLSALAALAAAALLAVAAPARAEPPLWVIKDADSTLYLFGTMHLLEPDMKWLTPRIAKAFDGADELWEEVALPGTVQEVQAQQVPLLLQRAASPDKTLTSLLTAQERAELQRAVARTPNPGQLGPVLDHMKPWFATLNLAISPMESAGFRATVGVDIVLAGRAHRQGKTVRGFETMQQQLDILAAGSEAEQLATLRFFLGIPDALFDGYIASSARTLRAWMNGDAAPMTARIDAWRTGVDFVTTRMMPCQALVAERNEGFARQIAQLLDGKGVAFIAVGAGHLVGPDSVQAKLAARGIQAMPY
jgi:uncharacterized protein YbaP (TraB family)